MAARSRGKSRSRTLRLKLHGPRSIITRPPREPRTPSAGRQAPCRSDFKGGKLRLNFLSPFIHDGIRGGASLEVDIAKGGIATVIGNVIGQGSPTARTRWSWPTAAKSRSGTQPLYVAHNTFINYGWMPGLVLARDHQEPAARHRLWWRSTTCWSAGCLLAGRQWPLRRQPADGCGAFCATWTPSPTHPETLAAQALGWIDEATRAITPPIHVSSTYLRDPDNQYRSGRVYARADNPAFDQAEAVINALEGGHQTLLFASGMAAATAVFQAWRRATTCWRQGHVLVAAQLADGLCHALGPAGRTDRHDLPAAVQAALRPGRPSWCGWRRRPTRCGR
jgi:hypothetical protein